MPRTQDNYSIFKQIQHHIIGLQNDLKTLLYNYPKGPFPC